MNDGDEAWFHKLASHGFTDADICSIVDSVTACSNWNVDSKGVIVSLQHGEPYDLSLSLAKTWYTNTWVSQEGIPNVMLADQGSLAGTPFADLAYTFAMSRVFCVFLETRIAHRGEWHSPQSGGCVVCGRCYHRGHN